jgi:DNA repair protein SbcD/Mre11
MKFAHFADCHVGGWKEEKLKKLNMACFKSAMEIVLDRQVDFLVLSGDLFNTAIPQIDYIKEVTSELKKLKDKSIPIYAIAGSHDYSPSGKTMLDVLEKAGLLINVMKFNENGELIFTVDPKTNAKITGMIGKKGGLEINDYRLLDTSNLEREEGFKIFLFHTAINEFTPKSLEKVRGTDSATLPENFQYYAGGHMHYVFQKEFGQGVLTFPGALFPNNFKEMEEWKHGGLYIVDEKVNWEYVPVKLKDVATFKIDVEGLSPEQATRTIIDHVKARDIEDKIVTLRIRGEIEGKTSDISFKDIYTYLDRAYFVLRNTAKLISKKSVLSSKGGSVEEIEQELFTDSKSEAPLTESNESDLFLTKSLFGVLNTQRADGEKVIDFEERVSKDALRVLKFENP